jgi:uncharacterized protein DUF5996
MECRSPTSNRRLHELLCGFDIDVEIKEVPYGLAWDSTPFSAHAEHASWDPEAVHRFGRILDWKDSVFVEFSGWFNGKTSPVHLFWHSFDLAVTRFSGRPGAVIEDNPVDRETYSHEVISFGFWPGDDNVPDAHYYSYTAPEPDGLREERSGSGMGRLGERLSCSPPIRVSAQRASTTRNASLVPRVRVRSRGSPRGLGYIGVRVQMVPDPRAAERAARHRSQRIRPSRRKLVTWRA